MKQCMLYAILLVLYIVTPMVSSIYILKKSKLKVMNNSKKSEDVHYIKWIQYVMCFAIWYHLYNLKNVKNTHEGVLRLVKLQAEAG